MKILWLEDVTLCIVNSVIDEQVDDFDVEFKKGEVYTIDIVDENETHVDLQFGSGSMAFGVFKGHYVEITDKGVEMSGNRSELVCPICGAPQNELDEVDEDFQSFEYECSNCKIRFKISVKNTYEVVDIKSI